MRAPAFKRRFAAGPALAASFVGVMLAVGGCKTNSTGGPPSVPSPSGSTSGSSGSAGAPASSSPAPAATPAPGSAPAPSSAGSAEPSLPPSGTQSGAHAAGTAGGDAAPPAAAGQAQTSDERVAAIDRRLNDSLGTLDQAVQKEQERTAKERDARNATGTASGSADTESQPKDGDLESGTADTEATDPASGNDADAGGKSRPGDLKSDKQRKTQGGANGSTAAGSGAGATEIPDGSDDDIVARRLRKAAEQETDPELKEKLWQEYIEYKKNAGKS